MSTSADVFAYAILEMDIRVMFMLASSSPQTGAVENLLGLVESSVFKVRASHDERKLLERHREPN